MTNDDLKAILLNRQSSILIDTSRKNRKLAAIDMHMRNVETPRWGVFQYKHAKRRFAGASLHFLATLLAILTVGVVLFVNPASRELKLRFGVASNIVHLHIANPHHGRVFPRDESEDERYRLSFTNQHKIGYQGRISLEANTTNLEDDARAGLIFLQKMYAKYK